MGYDEKTWKTRAELDTFFVDQRGRPADRWVIATSNKLEELKKNNQINDATLIGMAYGILECARQPKELTAFFPSLFTDNGYSMALIEKDNTYFFMNKVLQLYANWPLKPEMSLNEFFTTVEWKPSRTLVKDFIRWASDSSNIVLLKICATEFPSYFKKEDIWNQARKKQNLKVLHWLHQEQQMSFPEEQVRAALIYILKEARGERKEVAQKESAKILADSKHFQHVLVHFNRMDKAFKQYFKGCGDQYDSNWFYEAIGEAQLSSLWKGQKLENVAAAEYKDSATSPLTTPIAKRPKI